MSLKWFYYLKQEPNNVLEDDIRLTENSKNTKVLFSRNGSYFAELVDTGFYLYGGTKKLNFFAH